MPWLKQLQRRPKAESEERKKRKEIYNTERWRKLRGGYFM